MSTASLMLDKEASSDWVINRMKGSNWGDKPNVGHASLSQFLPGFYVAMSVKESGKCYSEPDRNAEAVKVYKSFAVPAFLRWLVGVDPHRQKTNSNLSRFPASALF
ncbi:unnamed protein product [Ectocarpus sp. CCAP 1310/34]|nr:unnamed protein product [Ectocarpus sp. CCAP 1310/34]